MDAAEAIAKMNEEKPDLDALVNKGGAEQAAQTEEVKETSSASAQAVDSNKSVQAEAGKSGAAQEVDVPDDVFFARLSKLTDGAVKSTDDFQGLIKQRNELAEQAKKGFEPKFSSEKAKLAHQILSQSAGDEIPSAMRTLRALAFDLSGPAGKDPKDILFEKFLLDPKNSDLSPSKAQSIFEAEYESEYGEMEGNVLKQRKHDVAVREAKESILKVQNDFKLTEEKPRQVAQFIETGVAESVKGFKGLKLEFPTSDPKVNDSLNVAIDNPQQLQMLQDMILNPDKAYNELVSQFETADGYDFDALRDELYQRANHKELRQKAFEEGRRLGKLDKVNEASNASQNGKDISKQGQQGARVEGKQTLEQAWAKAAGVTA